MSHFTNHVKTATVFSFAVLIMFILGTNLYSQDLFGRIKIPYAGEQEIIKVKSSTNMFMCVWGGGIYKSTDGGKIWAAVNAGLTNLLVTDLAIASTGELYTSTFGGGVFKSTNNGTAWTNVSVGITNMDVKTIMVYPNGQVFAGTYGSGVFKSINGGTNWTAINNGLFYKEINTISYSPNGYLLAGTYGGGIWKSADTGRSWQRASSGLKSLFINRITNSGNGSVYAATNGRGACQSIDGISWRELDTFYTPAWAADPSPLPDMNATAVSVTKTNYPIFATRTSGIYFWDPNVYYTYRLSDVYSKGVNDVVKTSTGDLIAVFPSEVSKISTDNGAVWKYLGDLPQNLKQTKIYTPKNNLFVLYDTSTIMKRSLDSGKTWLSTGNAGSNPISFCVDSTSGLYLGTKSGIFKSMDNGATWSARKALKDTSIYCLQVSPSGKIFAATSWVEPITSPPPPPPPPPKFAYRVYSSTDNGETWVNTSLSLTETDGPGYFMVINSKGDIYVGCQKSLKVSYNDGNTWQTLYTFKSDIKSVEINSLDYIYVGQNDGIYECKDFIAFSKMAVSAPSCSEIHITKKDIMYAKIVTADIKTGGLFYTLIRSTDGGTKWNSLANNYTMDGVLGMTSTPDGDFYMTTTSGNLFRAVEPTTMIIPTLATVPDNTQNVPLKPTLTWQYAPKADLYQFELSEYDDFSYLWEQITHSELSHTIQRSLEYNKTYYWRVRSKNHSAISTWSNAFKFSTPLAKPVLVSPVNDSIGVTVVANLFWHPVDGATKYQVQISKDKAFAVIAFNKSDLTDTTSITSKLEGLTKYYWRVKASSGTAISEWSDIWAFTTVLGPPVLLFPLDKSIDQDVNLTFKWKPALKADSYVIEISELEDFSTTVYSGPNSSDTSHLQNGLEYFKQYYWRVRSVNKNGISEWSDAWSFITGLSPVVLTSPKNNAVHQIIKLKLTWEQHSVSNDYELLVANDADFKSILYTQKVNGKTEFEYTYENFKQYYWKVRSVTANNVGNWSVVWNFRTSIAQTFLRLPDDKSINQPITIAFTWFPVVGAAHYHLQVANDAVFNNLIFSQDTLSNINKMIADLKTGTNYYWRVRGISGDGIGDWSPVWSFTTGKNIPVLIYPENAKTDLDKSITFKWDPVPEAQSYKLQISKITDMSNPVFDLKDLTQTVRLVEGLENSTTYYWRVAAKQSDGTDTPWSQIWSFLVKNGVSVDEDFAKFLTISTYPNPFSTSFNILLNLKESQDIQIKVMDLAGFEIVNLQNGILGAGNYNFVWTPSQVSSGTYFYQIITSKGIITQEIKYVK